MSEPIRVINNKSKNNMIGGAMMFSNAGIDVGVDLVKRTRRYDRERVRRFLSNPYNSHVQLQEVSEHLMTSSGNYFRIIKYLSSLFLFDFMLQPKLSTTRASNSKSMLQEYEEIAHQLNGMNIRRNLRSFLEELLILGEVYLYEVETDKGITYIRIPNSWCRVSSIDNGVYRFDVNTSSVDEASLEYMPKEIQNASKKNDDWVRIGENGFAFNVLGDVPKGIPFLSFMFDDIMGLEDTKDLIENKSKLDAVKLIHQKIPLNEKHVPIFNMNIARDYHNATKRNLPDAISVTTNPMDITHIPLDKAQAQERDIVERAERNLFNSVGISDLLFSGSKSGGETMRMSVIADETLIVPFLRVFEDYINSKIESDYFEFRLLNTTHFNQIEKSEQYKDAINDVGGSRLLYLASIGHEPIDIISIFKFEQEVLDIDSLMVAKKTSYTMSNNDGRPPSKGVVSEKTEKNKEGK